MDRRDLLMVVSGIGAANALSIPAAGNEQAGFSQPRWVRWKDEQEHVTVTVDGKELDMAYVDRGGAGDEPPVFMLHGIPVWSFIWRDVVPALTDERRVIVPDMVGYGESAQFDGFDRSIRANEVAFESLLDELGIDPKAKPIDLVGHDLGGGGFLRYAVHNPDHVRKLVLSNSVQYNSWALEPVCDLAQPANIQNLTNEQFAEILEDFYQLGLYDGKAVADETVDPIAKNAERSFSTAVVTGTSDTANPAQDAEYEWRYGSEVLIGPDSPTETIPEDQKEFVSGNQFPYVRRGDQGRISVARNAHATNTSHTTEVDPSEITADTLMLWGEDDVFQPISWAFRLEEDIENSEVVSLERARHWCMEDRPEAYRQEVRKFLLEPDEHGRGDAPPIDPPDDPSHGSR